ncbi:hypothetical protein F5Y15DRAFT_384107 [Xylariaceae sp. FL0016]|nr:hypothetical protein F5Y15DRAFT_384107 [Xylariaceae sp. FL0016]
MYSLLSALLAVLSLAFAVPFHPEIRDSNPGCQAASFGDFEWTIQTFSYNLSYVYTTPAHHNDYGSIGFDLANPALEYQTTCEASSSSISTLFLVNHDCTMLNGSTTETTFSFSQSSGLLDVNQTWVCSNEDPQYPTTFHAYGSVNLTSSISCSSETTTNPDWELGETYSEQEVVCGPVTIALKPDEITAVA